MVSLTPCLAVIAFLRWRANSKRLLIEQLDLPLEDQLAVDLRALIPIITKTELKSEAETAARHHLIAACRMVLVAVGFNVLNTGTVSPRAPIADDREC
jgi:hypothetical protein